MCALHAHSYLHAKACTLHSHTGCIQTCYTFSYIYRHVLHILKETYTSPTYHSYHSYYIECTDIANCEDIRCTDEFDHECFRCQSENGTGYGESGYVNVVSECQRMVLQTWLHYHFYHISYSIVFMVNAILLSW